MGNCCGCVRCRLNSKADNRWFIVEDGKFSMRRNTNLSNDEITQVQTLWKEMESKGYDIDLGILALRELMSRYFYLLRS